jgi:hypothetical protein
MPGVQLPPPSDRVGASAGLCCGAPIRREAPGLALMRMVEGEVEKAIEV